MSDELKACLNTDRELWRETPDDYYAPSIHVTERGGIGINVGGHVIVLPLRRWHQLAAANFPRTSQNHTVSSGVERAHEGTTADKSGKVNRVDENSETTVSPAGSSGQREQGSSLLPPTKSVEYSSQNQPGGAETGGEKAAPEPSLPKGIDE